MVTVLGICSLPWLGLILAAATGSLQVLAASLTGILGQGVIHLLLWRWAHLPLRYWWLTAAIILASAIRTTSGRNWTWRGRPLAAS
ncbi:hypothetical protein [Synechococcus sp. OH30]|uniref:hypothetical protein n=1 Tax=Synechococcus sp. OH30 TaxID=139352 RepID=UPI0039C04A5B